MKTLILLYILVGLSLSVVMCNFIAACVVTDDEFDEATAYRHVKTIFRHKTLFKCLIAVTIGCLAIEGGVHKTVLIILQKAPLLLIIKHSLTTTC